MIMMSFWVFWAVLQISAFSLFQSEIHWMAHNFKTQLFQRWRAGLKDMDVQRRVANKRGRNRSGKTPRKSKIYKINTNAVQEPGPSNKVEDNHKQVSAKTAAGSSGVWVDNSFGRNELATEGTTAQVYAVFCVV